MIPFYHHGIPIRVDRYVDPDGWYLIRSTAGTEPLLLLGVRTVRRLRRTVARRGTRGRRGARRVPL